MVCCSACSRTDTASLAPRPDGLLYISLRGPRGLVIHGVKSQAQLLELEVPQGPVLKPMLFTLYSAPVGIISHMPSLSVRSYADNNQLYLAFGSAEAEVSVIRVERCVHDIKNFLVESS